MPPLPCPQNFHLPWSLFTPSAPSEGKTDYYAYSKHMARVVYTGRKGCQRINGPSAVPGMQAEVERVR